MLALLRMKAILLSPTLSAFAPNLSKANAFSLYSRPSRCDTWRPLQNPSFFILKSTMSSQSFSKSQNADDHRGVYEETSGEIHVIVGPMFAGKTTTLLRRIKSERDNGRNVAIIKSDKDTRCAVDSIVSHDGEKYPCWPLADLSSFKQKIGFHAYDKLDVIGIDEAQFFGDLHDFCRRAADYDGKTIIIAGLDGDYLRRKFGSVVDIIPLADSVTKLTARCSLCSNRAFFTLRKTDDTKTELIGGANVYMPVCRQHYIDGEVVKEATTRRSVLEDQKVLSG